MGGCVTCPIACSWRCSAPLPFRERSRRSTIIRGGYSFCSSDSVSLAGDGSLECSDDYETLDSAGGDALVGTQCGPDGRFRYYFIYGYDDSGNLSSEAWFDSQGQI